MKTVVDTNILFTFFWKNSFTKGILVDQDIKFYSPEIALEELKRNFGEIKRKTKMSEEEFGNLLDELSIFVEFVPLNDYIESARGVDISDKDDIDFIALGLKLGCPVWSNDPHLKEQSVVEVFTTAEFVELLEKGI